MITNANLYISIAQQESASFEDPNTLLARGIYERLSVLIREAQLNASRSIRMPVSEYDDLRTHNAVLIDGTRGTGKSTVLVNLPRYLAQEANAPFASMASSVDAHAVQSRQRGDVFGRIHVLKPVDPTLLEEHDDLFLHVIVAAVLSDSKVHAAKQQNEANYREMLRALEELAHGLESAEAQKDERGLDKVRSFIGHRQLNSKVHTFFQSVLMLLDKDLLVLTIDDVDTALDRAYENLEVVRRYLNTPLVLPVISGDQSLYAEVILREFHGKIVKPAPSYRPEQANDIAAQLAIEYQRKVMPVPNRIRMPEVAEYLTSFEIELRDPRGSNTVGSIVSLGAFYSWLQALISGPVNEVENSRLVLPIHSIRALTQLIRRCGEDQLLDTLPSALKHAKNELDARRAAQLAPDISNELVDQFAAAYASAMLATDRNFRPAYEAFANSVQRSTVEKQPDTFDLQVTLSRRLRQQFAGEPEAGPAFLVLEAVEHWYGRPTDGRGTRTTARSVLSTSLFQPMRHSEQRYGGFIKQANLLAWKDGLANQLPAYWLEDMPDRKVLLPYPLPEGGRWAKLAHDFTASTADDRELLLLRLLTHSNYYSESNRGTRVNTGRLFELLIASLVRDVSREELFHLLETAPFHSTSTLAPTKTQRFLDDDASQEEDEVRFERLTATIEELVKSIGDWRSVHNLSSIRFSPWLVYNVFNKVFNQAQLFNRGLRIESVDIYASTICQIGLHAFYSTWSAFGSFEKGPLFGLPAAISTVNLDRTANFEKNPLFRQNILPFSPQSKDDGSSVSAYGRSMRAATFFLGSHPLRDWLEAAVGPDGGAQRTATLHTALISKQTKDEQANRYLRRQLGFPSNAANIQPGRLTKKFSELQPSEVSSILREMHDQYSGTEALRRAELAYRAASAQRKAES